MTDIKVQMTYIVTFLVDNYSELDNYNLEKLVHLMLDLLIQSTTQLVVFDSKLQLIKASMISSFKKLCAASDVAAVALDKNPQSDLFCKKLIQFAQDPSEL